MNRPLPDAVIPRVVRTPDSTDFFDAAATDRVLLRRCASCGLVRGPQVRWCPDCHAADHEPIDASGDAVLVSWSIVHRPPVAELAADSPVIACLVELAEGPWILTRLLCEPTADLHAGRALRLAIRRPDTTPDAESLVFAVLA